MKYGLRIKLAEKVIIMAAIVTIIGGWVLALVLPLLPILIPASYIWWHTGIIFTVFVSFLCGVAISVLDLIGRPQ